MVQNPREGAAPPAPNVGGASLGVGRDPASEPERGREAASALQPVYSGDWIRCNLPGSVCMTVLPPLASCVRLHRAQSFAVLRVRVAAGGMHETKLNVPKIHRKPAPLVRQELRGHNGYWLAADIHLVRNTDSLAPPPPVRGPQHHAITATLGCGGPQTSAARFVTVIGPFKNRCLVSWTARPTRPCRGGLRVAA